MPLPSYEGLFGIFARITSRVRVWYRLPYALAVPTLIGLRVNMRRDNLFNTERDPSVLKPAAQEPPRDQRTADGSYNDLGCPWMGMAGARFGRNAPIAETYGEQPPYLYTPNPRVVSRTLLARDKFIEVPHLNVLAAAWLQFMVHDWLSHGPGTKEQVHRLPLPKGDEWPTPEMIVLKTPPDDRVSESDAGQPVTYRNLELTGGTALKSTVLHWNGSCLCAPIRQRAPYVLTASWRSIARAGFPSTRAASWKISSLPE